MDSNNSAPLIPPPKPHRLPYNARLGLWLFLIYFIFYGGFMALNAFRPDLMSHTPFGGVNLAILYGMFLIAAALVLALIYMVLCRASRDSEDGQ